MGLTPSDLDVSGNSPNRSIVGDTSWGVPIMVGMDRALGQAPAILLRRAFGLSSQWLGEKAPCRRPKATGC